MAFLFALFDYIVIQLMQNEVVYKLFAQNASVIDAINCVFNAKFTSVLLFAIFLALRLKKSEKNLLKKYDYFIAILFSTFLLMAESFNKTNSLVLITASYASICLFIAMLIMLSNLIIFLLKWLKYVFLKIKENKKISEFLNGNKKFEFFEEHTFLLSFIIIFALWLPYILIRYPLVTEWDAYHQIIEGLGMQQINYNWPIASTLLFSSVIKLGYNIFGNYNDAGLLLVLFQSVVCAICLAYSMQIINKLKVNRIYKLLALLIFALAPIYARYTTAIVKDSLFACFVVFFVSNFIDIFVVKNQKLLNYILFFVISFIMCILRNNGIFLVIFLGATLIPLAFKEKQNWKIIVTCLIVAVTYKLYGTIIEYNGVEKGSTAEALSIPFQQTARYIVEHEDDVSNEEKEIINSVLNYDVIKEAYNPKLSDYVKGTYKGDNSKLKDYFGVWISQFFRHPLTYFSATFNNTYEYFLPGAVEEESGLYVTTNNDISIKLFDETLMHQNGKKALSIYITAFENMPIINAFCNTGIVFWIVIYLFIYAIFEKKIDLIIVLIPSIVGILVCIAGPTFTWNGIRYALPIIYSLPITLCVYLHDLKKS